MNVWAVMLRLGPVWLDRLDWRAPCTAYLNVFVLPRVCLRVSDVAAAEDKVTFTPGKKQSKFDTPMTREEMEAEQR